MGWSSSHRQECILHTFGHASISSGLAVIFKGLDLWPGRTPRQMSGMLRPEPVGMLDMEFWQKCSSVPDSPTASCAILFGVCNIRGHFVLWPCLFLFLIGKLLPITKIIACWFNFTVIIGARFDFVTKRGWQNTLLGTVINVYYNAHFYIEMRTTMTFPSAWSVLNNIRTTDY